jgi:glyoxylase I family protein
VINGIHHVAIHVRDFELMTRFYRDAFNFKIVGDMFSWENSDMVDSIIGLRNSAAKGAMLRAGNCYIEMFEFSKPAARNVDPLRPSDHGYTHFCVDVTDIDAEFDRLSRLGMRFENSKPVTAGAVKSIYGKDPEGNVIEIQETLPECAFALSAKTT